MSPTCFEPESSSSGRQLYIQSWYGTFYMHHYKQSCKVRIHSSTYNTAYTDACKAKHTITVQIIVFLKMNPRVRKLEKT
jgi:hypothetical protein